MWSGCRPELSQTMLKWVGVTVPWLTAWLTRKKSYLRQCNGGKEQRAHKPHTAVELCDTYRATKEQRRQATHSNGDKGHTHKAIVRKTEWQSRKPIAFENVGCLYFTSCADRDTGCWDIKEPLRCLASFNLTAHGEQAQCRKKNTDQIPVQFP